MRGDGVREPEPDFGGRIGGTGKKVEEVVVVGMCRGNWYRSFTALVDMSNQKRFWLDDSRSPAGQVSNSPKCPLLFHFLPFLAHRRSGGSWSGRREGIMDVLFGYETPWFGGAGEGCVEGLNEHVPVPARILQLFNRARRRDSAYDKRDRRSDDVGGGRTS